MELKDIKKLLYVGMSIKKPTKYTEILRIEDDGFYYRIGEHNNKKKVKYQEVQAAINELKKSRMINNKWYKKEFPTTQKSNPCNFTTIGGLLVEFQLAEYKERKYVLKIK